VADLVAEPLCGVKGLVQEMDCVHRAVGSRQ
jgi:hypothetical protein